MHVFRGVFVVILLLQCSDLAQFRTWPTVRSMASSLVTESHGNDRQWCRLRYLEWQTAVMKVIARESHSTLESIQSPTVNRETQQTSQPICSVQSLGERCEHGQARVSQHWSSEGKSSAERKRPKLHHSRSGAISVQTNISTVSKVILEKLPRNWSERVRAFRSAGIPSCVALDTGNSVTDKMETTGQVVSRRLLSTGHPCCTVEPVCARRSQ